MKYISVCSGIESATVAFRPLGWKPLAFAETAAFPSAVLAHHYAGTPNLGDIRGYRDWPKDILAECDVIVGGPPCQAFSNAGAHRSLDDDRGRLTLTYSDLVSHIDAVRRRRGLEPCIVIYENVTGIYHRRDNPFGSLLGRLCGQKGPIETETGSWPTAGMFGGKKRRVCYRTLDARYFGLAQTRRRCFLVAVSNSLVDRVGPRACPSKILALAESVATADQDGRDISTKPDRRNVASRKRVEARNVPSPPRVIAFDSYGLDPNLDLAPTLTSKGSMIVVKGRRVRRLTPHEAERLQGFPTGYTLLPGTAGRNTETARYVALGNAIAVPCLSWIGRRIDAAFRTA